MHTYYRAEREGKDDLTHIVDDYGPAVVHTACGREYDHEVERRGSADEDDLPEPVCGHCKKAL